MNTEKTGFFDESPGHKSSVRLNSFILLLLFVFINAYVVVHHKQGEEYFTGDFILYNLVLLAGIFTPKYLQKLAELKFNGGLKTEEKTIITKEETKKTS